jgi:hypothetical protein
MNSYPFGKCPLLDDEVENLLIVAGMVALPREKLR